MPSQPEPDDDSDEIQIDFLPLDPPSPEPTPPQPEEPEPETARPQVPVWLRVLVVLTWFYPAYLCYVAVAPTLRLDIERLASQPRLACLLTPHVRVEGYVLLRNKVEVKTRRSRKSFETELVLLGDATTGTASKAKLGTTLSHVEILPVEAGAAPRGVARGQLVYAEGTAHGGTAGLMNKALGFVPRHMIRSGGRAAHGIYGLICLAIFMFPGTGVAYLLMTILRLDHIELPAVDSSWYWRGVAAVALNALGLLVDFAWFGSPWPWWCFVTSGALALVLVLRAPALR
jgi:hypothetical protein